MVAQSPLFNILTLELSLKVRAPPSPLADQTTSRIIAELGKKVNMRLHLRRGSPLACGVTCFVSSSFLLFSSLGRSIQESQVRYCCMGRCSASSSPLKNLLVLVQFLFKITEIPASE